MKISFPIDERVAEQARQVPLAMGKSLEQAQHDGIGPLAGRAQLETEIADDLESTARTAGRRGAWKYNRGALQRGASRHRRTCTCPRFAPTIPLR